jgi:uncharacterized membrane protein YagU involved in acid resistance
MTLVGNKSGRKRIIWGQLVKMSLFMVLLCAGATSSSYLLFAQQWNPLAAWLGLAGGASITLVILVVNFCTPIFRLPFIR